MIKMNTGLNSFQTEIPIFHEDSEDKSILNRTTSLEFEDPEFNMLNNSVNLRIFDNVYSNIESLSDEHVKGLSSELIDEIKYKLIKEHNFKDNKLSKLYINEQEDSSALIEWNYENFRIGFSLEPKGEKSSYYLVEKDSTTGYLSTLTKFLEESNISNVISDVLSFVVRST